VEVRTSCVDRLEVAVWRDAGGGGEDKVVFVGTRAWASAEEGEPICAGAGFVASEMEAGPFGVAGWTGTVFLELVLLRRLSRLRLRVLLTPSTPLVDDFFV
jgi:hypothetical protein